MRKRLSLSRPKWLPRDEFMIAFNFTVGLSAVIMWVKSSLFGGGICMGYALYQLMHLAEIRTRERWRKQSAVDINTLGDMIENIDGYKMLHHREKAIFN